MAGGKSPGRRKKNKPAPGDTRMEKQAIKQAITNRVASAYSAWTIGLTHDPDKRKEEHQADGKATTCWQQWVADSLSDAQDIESLFIQKSVKGGTGGDLSTRKTIYVYIF
jgi:hypothetical protein